MVNFDYLASQIWASLPEGLAPEFKLSLIPQVDLNLAHLSSDDFLRQAPFFKIDPVKVAQETVSRLARQTDYSCVAEQGYLNIFFNKVSTDLVAIAALPESINIYLPDFKFIGNQSATIRLAAGALLQARIASKLGVNVSFYYADSLLSSDYTQFIINKLSSDWSSSALAPGYTEYLGNQLRESRSSAIVWFTPDCLPKEIYSQFYLKNFRNSDNYIVCPAKLYLYGLDLKEQEYFIRHTGIDYAPMLIQLAGGSMPEEICLEESFLCIRGNLLWYISSLIKRLPEIKVDSQLINLDLLSDTERKLILYSIWVNHYIYQAVLRGSVREFITIATRICEMINLYFNSPQVRARVHQNRLSLQEQAIITVVRQALSAILTVF